MADPRLDAALARIAAALDRLEGRPAPAAEPDGLAARHAALRAAIAQAVADLDRLEADA